MNQIVPGTVEDHENEYIYVEVFQDEDLQKLIDYYTSGNPRQPRRSAFDIIMDGARASCPSLVPADGSACGAASALIKLPDGKVLYGLDYKGDLEGWRKRLLTFCRTTGRTYAIPRGQMLVVYPDAKEMPLSECEVIVFASRIGNRAGYDPPTAVLPREPKWETARPITQLARELLDRKRVTPLELLQIYAFEGDSADVDAHDDDLQDLLAARFVADFDRVKAELIKEFGEPAKTGDQDDPTISLWGTFRFAVWNHGDKTLHLAANHQDRELPYLLYLEIAKKG